MRSLKVFESISADGYFTGRDGDMSWAYAHGGSPELQAFVEGNTRDESTLVFGRVTYEMMAGYRPTATAAKDAPVVAKKMNAAEKLVASRTLKTLAWENARLLEGDAVAALRALEGKDGPPLVVLGSGKLVSALLAAGLVDDLQLVIKPVGSSATSVIPPRASGRRSPSPESSRGGCSNPRRSSRASVEASGTSRRPRPSSGSARCSRGNRRVSTSTRW